VLRTVVGVESEQDGAGLLFSQHGPDFIGGAVNVFGGPHERDSVSPVIGEELPGFADAPETGSQVLQ
jgi:hypothetical protein